MKFQLIDRIVELTRGERIVAVKAVSRAEEYLADHFPTFPILPGVFMLEALVQAAGWLVRDANDFQQSLILLREAKNVTYKSFVKPGNLLRLEVQCRRIGPGESDFDGVGYCNQEVEAVKARFCLVHRCVGQGMNGGQRTAIDERLIASARKEFELLRR